MSADSEVVPYRLDLARLELTRNEGAVALAPKVLRLLQCLVEGAGGVVTHDDLLDEVWSGVRVSSDAVRYAVRELRKALGDSPRSPRFVETVPRQGWRFVGQAISSGPKAWLLLPRGTGSIAPAPRPERAKVRVGRASEALELRSALSRAQSGRRQLRLISGEAGMGKTTLVDGFLDQIGEPGDVLVGRGRSIEHHGPSEAYAPILEALEELATRMGPIAVDTLRRYAPMWLASLPALTEPAERTAILQEIQGATQARMVRELSSALEALAGNDTIVLWLDDVHWSDLSTLECIADLMHRLDPARLLIVVAHRPAEAPRALRDILRTLEARTESAELVLDPLAPHDARAYATARFGLVEPDAEALGRFLHATTEGNPLFLVSVADGLVAGGQLSDTSGIWKIDRPLTSVDVPPSVRLLLERELDRASAAESSVLEVASLAGMEFSAAVIAAACELDVEEVEAISEGLVSRSSFLASAGTETWPDGTLASRYAFVHGLHREVLASGITAARRTRIHAAIGLRLEAAYAGHEDEVAAELARHFELARDTARAIRYRTVAGRRAAERFANPEAADQLRRALALLEELPAGEERKLLEIPIRLSINVPLAAIGGYASPELEANLNRILELTGEFQESTAAFPVMLGLWSLTIVRGDLETAGSLGERLRIIAEREGDAISRLQAHRTLGHTRFYEGRLRSSLEHLDAALDGYDIDAHERQDYTIGDDPVVLALSYGMWTHWFRGEPEQAIACSERALAAGERLDHPPSLVFARFYAAVLHHLRRDSDRALAAAEAALELATHEGLGFWAALSGLLHGYVRLGQGSAPAALQEIEDSLVAWEATGGRVGRPYFLTLVSDARARAGRLEDAFALLPIIDDDLERSGQRVFAPERHRLEGILRAERGELEAARECLVRAIGLAERGHVRGLALRSAISLAELQERSAVAPEAAERLQGVVYSFSEGKDEPDMQRARALLAELGRR